MGTRCTISLLVGAALSVACAPQTPPETFVPLSDEDRAGFFLAAIRDAGFPCEDVVSVARTNEFGKLWRISCTNATAYLVSVDESGVEIERLVYMTPRIGPADDAQ